MVDMYELREAYKNGAIYEIKRRNSNKPDPSPFFEIFRKEKEYDYCGITPQEPYQLEDEYDDCNVKETVQREPFENAVLPSGTKAIAYRELKKEAQGGNFLGGYDSDGFVIV